MARGGLVKKEPARPETFEPELYDRLERWFDDWMLPTAFRWPAALRRWPGAEMIRVDEFRENGTLVVRAELPGIDPEKNVELTVTGGMLHIEAHRQEEERKEDEGYVRRELRYGAFSRTLPLPEGTSEADVKATYNNGILEIRFPSTAPEPPKKIPITTS